MAVTEIIQHYTREAGVRNLEREIGKICRKIVTKLVRAKSEKNLIVTPGMVHKLLGVPLFQHDMKEESSKVGISMGLGGDGNGRRTAAGGSEFDGRQWRIVPDREVGRRHAGIRAGRLFVCPVQCSRF